MKPRVRIEEKLVGERVVGTGPSARIEGGEILRTVWIEVPLENGEWVAAYRVMAVEGRPVIAEVRLFPNVPKRGREAGRWAADRTWWRWSIPTDAEGWQAPPRIERWDAQERAKAVPAGGVPAKAVRALRAVSPLLENWDAATRRLRQAFGDSILTDQGFTTDAAEDQHRRPGRAGHGDLWYAQKAAKYANAAASSPRTPILELVAAEADAGNTYTATYIRDVMVECRRRGFLPSGGGGPITAKARRVLARAERSAQ